MPAAVEPGENCIEVYVCACVCVLMSVYICVCVFMSAAVEPGKNCIEVRRNGVDVGTPLYASYIRRI